MVNNKSIILSGSGEVIPNVFSLEKIGAGHDGIVFRYGNKALKVLKYDDFFREKNGLMTYNKATFFIENLNLKRITKPTDIFYDDSLSFAGYVMDFIEPLVSLDSSKRFLDFSCPELLDSILELDSDFTNLTVNGVLVGDINLGSYIYSSDFLHLCDMDKYRVYKSGDLKNRNKLILNFVIAKMLSSMMQADTSFSSSEKKIIASWIRSSSNSSTFYSEIVDDIFQNSDKTVGEFAKTKVKKILH